MASLGLTPRALRVSPLCVSAPDLVIRETLEFQLVRSLNQPHGIPDESNVRVTESLLRKTVGGNVGTLNLLTFQRMVGAVSFSPVPRRLLRPVFSGKSGTETEIETGTGRTQYMGDLNLKTTTYCGIL